MGLLEVWVWETEKKLVEGRLTAKVREVLHRICSDD